MDLAETSDVDFWKKKIEQHPNNFRLKKRCQNCCVCFSVPKKR